jgi:predicted PolB exonuclease-like 3'-5' exonuclease
MHTLAFDIETVPDTDFGRRLLGIGDLPDEDVARAMFFRQRQTRNTDFLPLPQQRIVAISVALRSRDSFRVWSLGDEDSPEPELVQRFFDGLDRYTPVLVSWNGSGFDLPVLNYRSLLHGVSAPRYWELGEHDREFRYNNYLSRFHWRHIDLMDVLSGFQPGGRASLEHIAVLLGFPGKLGMSGAQVFDTYQAGDLTTIRRYCETDVLNTYLIFQRFQLIRGVLDEPAYQHELDMVRDCLRSEAQPHFAEFLAAWSATA